jgi:predicted nucleic acid-binding protein
LIVLDTNVISELMRLRPERLVFDWVARQSPASLYITTITQAEILYGLARLPAGKRRAEMEAQYRATLTEEFGGRVLSFDPAAAEAYGPMMARIQRQGRPADTHDVQIAAIAMSRGAAVATRNMADFANLGIALIDPWTAHSA